MRQVRRYLHVAVLVAALNVLTAGVLAAENAQPFDVAKYFVASGWMGDGELKTEYVQLADACPTNPHSGPTCIQVTYKPGPNGWAGIYWQNEADNWGDKAGEDFSKKDYARVTFWAKGEKGGETIEFKAGGIAAPGKPYKDSFQVKLGKETLKKEWTKYTMDLKGAKLSSVIGGFCWVASGTANPEGAKFYLDDIQYEPANYKEPAATTEQKK